jgi:hypothetical protein
LCDAAQLLGGQDHDVIVVWLNLPSYILHRIRPRLMPLTAFNIYFTIKLIYVIVTKKPQLLWWHSISRYVWWLPVWVASWFHVRAWMMYHDLWYFHPYPSLVTDMSQIPTQRSLSMWLSAGCAVGNTSLVHTTMMTLKYRSISMIRRALLRSVSIHLVPSPYMVGIVRQRWVPADQIKILGHFGRTE